MQLLLVVFYFPVPYFSFIDLYFVSFKHKKIAET